MQTRKIGSLSVSTVGLGCNNFGGRLDASQTADVVSAGLDAGINFFDTADIYGGTKSEEFLGQAIKGRRDEVVLATKFGGKVDEQRHGAKAAYVKRALEDSLRRLETDYVDLYQLHMPDETTPIAETLGALGELVSAGKVREIGCSNFNADQLREAQLAAGSGARFVSLQNHFSLLHRDPQKDVLPECVRLGIGFIPYFPLANGLLSGKYRKGAAIPEGTRIAGWAKDWFNDANMDKVEKLITFADRAGYGVLDLAFAWLLANKPVVSVIAGATSAQQVAANANAARWNLSAADLAEVDILLA